MKACETPSKSLVVIVGSSNSAGMGASTYIEDPNPSNGFRNPQTSWIGLIEGELSNACRIVNWSVSGQGSLDTLRRADDLIFQMRPQVALFCPNPVNDNLDASLYFECCESFLDICNRADVVAAVRGGYAWNEYTPTQYRAIKLLNERLKSLGVRYLDHMACLDDGSGHFIGKNLFTADGLHPNDDGHRILAQGTDLALFKAG